MLSEWEKMYLKLNNNKKDLPVIFDGKVVGIGDVVCGETKYKIWHERYPNLSHKNLYGSIEYIQTQYYNDVQSTIEPDAIILYEVGESD